jgi:hypothetical protein
MTKTIVRAALVAFSVALSGAAFAQTAPPHPPAAAPAHPPAAAPAPAPVAAPPPAAPAPAPAPPPPAYPGAPPPAAAPPPGGVPAPGQPPGAPLAPSPMYEPPPPPPPVEYGAPPPPPPEKPRGTRAFVGHAMVGFAWDLGIPLGSVHNFTSNVSGLGFDISFHYWLHPQFTVGGEVEWQTYTDQKDRTTYPITNGALTATAYNSLQAASLRAGAQYYLVDDGLVLPYVGVNLGYGWSTFQSAAADILLYDNQDSFIFGADLGAVFAIPGAPLFKLAGRYSNAPAMEFLKVENVQALTFQLGVMLL